MKRNVILSIIDLRKVTQAGILCIVRRNSQISVLFWRSLRSAGSIILTREAQQRRSQNSSPNRFHSSDMRAFFGVHAKCCQHMMFFISRIDRRKENQRQGDNDWVIESVFAQWCNKEEDQSAWRDLCNNRCTMCDNRCTTIIETTTCNAQCVTTSVTTDVQPICSWRF